MLGARRLALVDGVAGPGGAVANHEVRYTAADVAVLVLGEVEDGAAPGRGVAHQLADDAEALRAVPRADEEAEVGAAGALGAERQ